MTFDSYNIQTCKLNMYYYSKTQYYKNKYYICLTLVFNIDLIISIQFDNLYIERNDSMIFINLFHKNINFISYWIPHSKNIIYKILFK